jgi:hypothetical protein
MKNILFPIALLASFCGLLKAADQHYQFDAADAALFKVGDKMRVLYSTAFINSVLADNRTTVERAPLLDICNSATAQSLRYKQIMDLKIVSKVFGEFESEAVVSTARDRASDAKTLVGAFHQFLKTIPDTSAIAMYDYQLLLFLQFGTQSIKRTAEKLELTLHPADQLLSKTLVAPPLLAQFMEKYHAHENHDISS